MPMKIGNILRAQKLQTTKSSQVALEELTRLPKFLKFPGPFQKED